MASKPKSLKRNRGGKVREHIARKTHLYPPRQARFTPPSKQSTCSSSHGSVHVDPFDGRSTCGHWALGFAVLPTDTHCKRGAAVDLSTLKVINLSFDSASSSMLFCIPQKTRPRVGYGLLTHFVEGSCVFGEEKRTL